METSNVTPSYFVGIGGDSSDFIIRSHQKTVFRLTPDGIKEFPHNPFFDASLPSQLCSGVQTGSEIRLSFAPSNVIKNIGGHYNQSSGAFTAPVSGDYHLISRVHVTGLTGSRNLIDLILNVGSKSHVSSNKSVDDNSFSVEISRIVSMTAGEVAQVVFRLLRAVSDTAPINVCLSPDLLLGNQTTHYSTFSGYKIN